MTDDETGTANELAEAKAEAARWKALADEIERTQRPQGLQRSRGGQHAGLRAFSRTDWLAAYDEALRQQAGQ